MRRSYQFGTLGKESKRGDCLRSSHQLFRYFSYDQAMIENRTAKPPSSDIWLICFCVELGGNSLFVGWCYSCFFFTSAL